MPTFNNISELITHLKSRLNKDVPLEEFMDNEFMALHTQFHSIGEFLSSGGFTVKSTSEFESLNFDALNKYISANSSFSNWAEMKNSAGARWIKKQIGQK